MKKKYYDISAKIDPIRKELLTILNEITEDEGIEFLVVGATARDIILEYCYGIDDDLLATQDLDIAINVKNWEQFNALKNKLLARDSISATAKEHRLKFMNVFPFDIIPFGKIEDSNGKIYLPPDQLEMTTLGFNEALKNAFEIKIDQTSDIQILVTSLEDLFVMKLIAWDEKYPDRKKDAKDMSLIMNKYLEGNAVNKLYEIHTDLLDTLNFDFEIVTARILGRDIAESCNQQTVKYVKAILEKEINPKFNLRLARDMKYRIIDETEYDSIINMLQSILAGISDIQNSDFTAE